MRIDEVYGNYSKASDVVCRCMGVYEGLLIVCMGFCPIYFRFNISREKLQCFLVIAFRVRLHLCHAIGTTAAHIHVEQAPKRRGIVGQQQFSIIIIFGMCSTMRYQINRRRVRFLPQNIFEGARQSYVQHQNCSQRRWAVCLSRVLCRQL